MAARTKATTGKRMTKGKYSISPVHGLQRKFRGTLIGTINMGAKRLAIFSVPKSFK